MMSPINQEHFVVHSVLNTNGFYRLPMHVLALILKLLGVDHATNPKIIQQNTIVGLLALVPQFDPSKENFFSQPKHLEIAEDIRVYMHSILKDLTAQLKVTPPESLATPGLAMPTYPCSALNYPAYYPAGSPEMLQQMQQMMYYRTFGINPSLGLISNSKPLEKEQESSHQKKEPVYYSSQQHEPHHNAHLSNSDKPISRFRERQSIEVQPQVQEKKERIEGESRIIFETSHAHVERESIIVEEFQVNSNQEAVKIEEVDVAPVRIVPNSCSVDIQTQMTLMEDDLIVNIRDLTLIPLKKAEKRNRREAIEVYNRKPTQSRGGKKTSDNLNQEQEIQIDKNKKQAKENKAKKPSKNEAKEARKEQVDQTPNNKMEVNELKIKQDQEMRLEMDERIQKDIEYNLQKDMNEQIRREINEDIQKEQEEFNLKHQLDDSPKQSKCQEENFLRVPLSNDDISQVLQPCDPPSHQIYHHEEDELLPHEKQLSIDHEIEQIKPIEPSPEDREREFQRIEQERAIMERQRELFEEKMRQMAREREAEREREMLEELERQAELTRLQEIERQIERQLREQKIREEEQQRKLIEAQCQRREQERLLEEQRRQDLIRQEEMRQLQLLQAEEQQKRYQEQLERKHVLKFKHCLCEGKSYSEEYYCCFTCEACFHWQCLNIAGGEERTECFNCRLRKMEPLHPVKDVIGEYYITDITTRKFTARLSFESYTFINAKSHRNHEIQLRCFRVDSQTQRETTEITWPDECTISLNDEKISELYALRMNSLLKKRKDYPITLPNFKIFTDETAEDNYRNIRISLQVCAHTKEEAAQKRINNKNIFLFGIYCIKRITVEALYRQIMDKEIQHSPQTYLTDLIAQFSLEREVFRLTDPYAWTQIVTPVRGIRCNHGQCFDLRTYLTFMAGMTNRNWRCPVCLQQTKQFKFDSVYNELIKKFAGTDQLPTQVAALSDGCFILKMMVGDEDSEEEGEKRSKKERKTKKMEEKEEIEQPKALPKAKGVDKKETEMRSALIKQQHIEIDNQSNGDQYLLPSKGKKQSTKNKNSRSKRQHQHKDKQ